MDFKRFSIYVRNTKVLKGWDWIVLPDGRRVSVAPGKYLKPISEKPLVFGFEDLTVEIGEKPDWDFNEPRCELVSETGVFKKNVKLRCTYEAAYTNELRFNGKTIAVFEAGTYTRDVEFTYVDWTAVGLAIIGVVGAGAAVYGIGKAKKKW